MKSPLTRFSDRVEDYVKYRPDYPPAVFGFLADCGLLPSDSVADLGCGTGIFARRLLENGNTVYGVEPNREMREAAVRFLAGFPLFHAVDGTSDATTLPSHSVELVTAAQAFHWFPPEGTRVECRRILKPGGKVALVWNFRRTDTSPFLVDYETLLARFAVEYYQVRQAALKENGGVEKFFEGRPVKELVCPSHQELDLEALKGRLLSSSYAPKEGHPNHAPMMAELRVLFEKYQSRGFVRIDYDTEVTIGSLD